VLDKLAVALVHESALETLELSSALDLKLLPLHPENLLSNW